MRGQPGFFTSDERAEFLINDRLSFMRFLGLGLEDRVPDARTIWLFREKLDGSKTWSISSISDFIGLDGFGAKACGGSQAFSASMIGGSG